MHHKTKRRVFPRPPLGPTALGMNITYIYINYTNKDILNKTTPQGEFNFILFFLKQVFLKGIIERVV